MSGEDGDKNKDKKEKLRIKITKKKIVGIVLLVLFTNVLVNVSLTVPLAYTDFKLLYVKYDEKASTSQYSVLEVKVLARNNLFLPTKIGRIDFEIYESEKGGLVGIGSFGPVSMDPGQISILKIILKLYKTDATVRFVKNYLKTQKLNGKIKVYYPLTWFGVIEMFRIPVDVDLNMLFASGESAGALSAISFSMPSFQVRKIDLTKETSEYAEARVDAYGVVPSELSGIGQVEIKNLEIIVTNDVGHVLDMYAGFLILDTDAGQFNANITLRFIKGNALKAFLDRLVKRNELIGKIRARFSLTVFGLELYDMEYESDLSEFESFFSPTGGSMDESTSSIFSALSDLFSNMIRGIAFEYMGMKAETKYGLEHEFNIGLTISNPSNWTLGWGNINVTLLRYEGNNEISCITISQEESILIKPEDTAEANMDIKVYDNDALYSMLQELLYYQKYNFTVRGYLDVYFAGVWLRGISIDSPLGQVMTGQQGSPAGFFEGMTPVGGVPSLPSSEQSFLVESYDVLSTKRDVIIKANALINYPKLPIGLFNVSGDIFYDGYYVGSIYIDKIDLDSDGSTATCRPNIQVKISKTTPVLGDFINAFIKNDWSSKTMFIGSVDLKFLSRYYPNVPLRLNGDMFSDVSSDSVSSDMLSGLYSIENMTYLGEQEVKGETAHVLLVNAEITNPVSSPIKIMNLDINVKMDDPRYPEYFATIKLVEPVTIGSRGTGTVAVEVYLYDNEALKVYLNKTIRGFPVGVVTEGALDIDVGGLHINTTEYKTKIVSSMMSTISSAAEMQYSMFYKGVELLNITEYSDWIEAYVRVNTSIPIPLVIDRLIARVSLKEDTEDYPVVLEVVEPIEGPGSGEALIRIILYNSSSEFESFIKEFVYGDADSLFTDISLDLRIFGYRFEGIQLFDMKIEASMSGDDQSALSALKFDNRMIGVKSFTYNGKTMLDGMEAYNMSIEIEFNNLYGINIGFGDALVYVSNQGYKVARIEIGDTYNIPSRGTACVKVNVYIYRTDCLKGFLENLLVYNVFNADVEGSLYVKIFGVELPNVRFVYSVFSEIAESSGLSEYQDVGLMYNASLRSISVLFNNESRTDIMLDLEISDLRLPIKLHHIDLNISLPEYDSPALRIKINSSVDFEPTSSKNLRIFATVYKNDMDHIREFLRLAIESNLRAIKVWGTTYIEVFGVNLSLPFRFDNLSMAPTSSQVAVGSTLPDIALGLEDIKYVGETWINDRKAYRLDVSSTVDNILGLDLAVGPFNIEIIRDNVTVIEILMDEEFIIEPYESSSINFTMLFYSGDETYEFLRDLIENFTFNGTIHGSGNITVFGIDIPNIDISYAILTTFRSAVAGNSVGSVPFPNVQVSGYEIGVIDENDTLARIYIDVNFTNPLVMPFELLGLDVSLYKDGEISVEMILSESLDLSNENSSTAFYVTLYKTNATIKLIRELVARKITNVDIIGDAGFRFLEWNFSIGIDVNNMEYSSDGTGGTVAPLGFDDVLVVDDIRQISSMGLRLYLRFNNIVNTTIGLGRLDFDVSYDGVRVVHVETPEYYEVGPGGNTTLVVDIYFENVTQTQRFLTELLVNRTFNATVDGVVDISIFGLNITRLSLSEYVFMSLTDTTTGSSQIAGLNLPEILSAKLKYSKDMGSYLEMNMKIEMSESPITFSIEDLRILLSNDYGRFGEILIPELSARYGQNITGDIFIRLYDQYPNNALAKFIRDSVEKKILDLSINGKTDITIFGFEIRDVPVEFDIYQSLEDNSSSVDSSSFSFALLNVEQFLLLGDIKQTSFGPYRYDLNGSIQLMSPIDTQLAIGDMNISVLKSDTEIIKMNIDGHYAIDSSKYTNVNISVSFFDVPELHDFIEELIVDKKMNITIVGSLDLSLLGAAIDDLKLNYTFATQEGGGSTMATQQMFGIAGLGAGFSIKNITYIDENGTWARTILDAEIQDSPVYIKLDFLNVSIGNEYGYFVNLFINETTELNVSSITNMSVFLSVLKGSEGLREFLIRYLKESVTFVNIRGTARLSLFNNDSSNLQLDLPLDFKNVSLGSTGVPEGTSSMIAFPLTGYVEFITSEKIGGDGEGYLKLLLEAEVGGMPLPVKIENLNITVSNEYDLYGPILNAYVPEANFFVDKGSRFNMTIKIYERIPNKPLAKFIRDVVERKILQVNISGSVDLEIFGVRVDGIPINISVNQSLESIESGNGEQSQFLLFFPAQQLFVFEGIEQLSDPHFGSPYDLVANISMKSPINITIGMGDMDLSIARDNEYALRLLSFEYYQIDPDDYTRMLVNLKVYDNKGTYNLFDDLMNRKLLNASLVGKIDLDFLGAHLDDLHLNMTLCQNISSYGEGIQQATSFSAPSISYQVLKVLLNEDDTYAYIDTDVEIEGVPVYLEIYYLNITLSNEYGDFAYVLINDTAMFSPFETGSAGIYIKLRKGTQALKEFIEGYIKNEGTYVNINGEVEVKLFGKFAQYLTLRIPLELNNVTYEMGDSEGAIVPIDITQYLKFKMLEYMGDYFDYSVGYRGYQLNISFDFINNLNISFGVYGAEFYLSRNNATIMYGALPELVADKGENTSTFAKITLYDRPETATFLQDLISNYDLIFSADVYVSSIQIFGVAIEDISLSQIMNWNVSTQVEGGDVQSSVTSMFNMTIGSIRVVGEDPYRAQMEINVTVFDSKIAVLVNNLDLDIKYQGTTVAHVVTYNLELDNERNTTFNITLTIYKDNKTALQGFLNDLLVNKNVTMDVWGEAYINLFRSEYLNLDISFKYNNTKYAVEDYYSSLTSGEVDTSTLLDQVIQYSAENVKWKFISENDTHVVIRLSEIVHSELNIKIYDMVSYLYTNASDPSTMFAIQRLVGDVDIPAGGEGNITIEIVFLKNEYLKEFLDAALHEWSIGAWIDTTIDLELFGVNITDLRAVSVKYSFVITQDVIQTMVTGTVEDYTGSMQSSAVSLEPLGYGNWYDSSDLYGGIVDVVNNVATYAVKIWENSPEDINVWDYRWILLKYNQSIGTYDFRVSMSNFRAILVFTGEYIDGEKASGIPEQDFIGEIYIDNLTLYPDRNNTFYAYVRFWRSNRLNGMVDSHLKDFVWSMVNQMYNFSAINISFNLAMWGCYISNVSLEGLNFTGAVDLSDIGSMIEFGGMTGWSVGINFGEGVYFDARFKVKVPMSPEWMIYYSMLLTWDDDPVYFEDVDSGPDDPPTTGDYSDTLSERYSEVEELVALDPSAQPLGHTKQEFWIAPQIHDAPTSIPSYAVWFGSGGEYELFVRLDIEWTDAFHDYIGNAYVDQNYDDEELTAQGKKEEEDAYAPTSPWEGLEDGDMWALVFFSYETEILMFWWILYYYTPSFYIVSGDYNPHIANGRLYINKTWILHDYNWVYQFELYGDKINVNGAKIFDLEVTGGQMFVDSYDGGPDQSEPDYSGNYHI